MRRGSASFQTIRVEGAILPPDLLQRIADGDKSLGGLMPADYHLVGNEKLNEATNRSWNRLLGAWSAFRAGAGKLPDSDPKTSLTRERWLLPLFQELGYGRLTTVRAIELDGKSFAVSHLWAKTPIHLIGCGVDLDVRSEGVAGAARMTPHGLAQELLNRSDDFLWGFVSNGFRLRILRDNSSLTRQAYVEFDLEAMMEGEVYSDFVLLWLLCHQSRVEADKPEECWLEIWSKAAQEQGTRALDQLRDGVTAAISALGTGLISHPANRELREGLRAGALDKQDFYRELLRLVYRLLFMFVAEDRELLLAPDADREAKARYVNYYSTQRLRRLAGRRRGGKHPDLFYALRLVMQKLGSDDGCPGLGLPALGGFLFSPEAIPDIEACEIANHHLLEAIRALAFTLDGAVLRPVDYRNLGSEELGSVYESLLELHPELNLEGGVFNLRTAAGNERKTTGSYYTPTGLIQILLDSALDPVLDEAVKKPNPEEALLSLKVCDPACGSGHFLIAAAHRIAKRVASVRTGDIEPSPEATRTALRQVISRCIYGVDINPMSVELCKVALWMEAIDPGKPLSFLDHHIQCGNSLIGATPRLLREGIPDAAFDPVEGDDKAVCSEYKKRNKKEREGQGSLFAHDMQPWEQLGNLATAMMGIDSETDGSIAAEHRKQERYERLVASSAYENGKLLADTWCAAFFWKKTRQFDYPITEEVYRRIERTPHACPDFMRPEIERLAEQYQFFHWHLAFPDVFRVPANDEQPENEEYGCAGGFDCVLGNPPWEKVKLQEQEFFAQRDPDIANAPNKAARAKLIQSLPETRPSLALEFGEAKREAEAESSFVRSGGRFPLTAVGDVNTYALFTELSTNLVARAGIAGMITPVGMVTEDFTKGFLRSVTRGRRLSKVVGFENEAFIFPAVHHAYKFCAVSIAGPSRTTDAADLVFLCRHFAQVKEPERHFSLRDDEYALLNPNSLTCPVFRTRADAELTKSIHRRVPALMTEPTDANPWSLRFATLFHMANDSGLFITSPGDGAMPLYEAKMLHHFDHRWGTYENATQANLNAAILPQPNQSDKIGAAFRVVPRYWVQREDLESKMPRDWSRRWYIAFRNVAAAVNERTAIFAIMPRLPAGHSVQLLLPTIATAAQSAALVADLSSMVLDYCARQKISGINVTYGFVRQFPVPPPSTYESLLEVLVSRVVELVYTAWDIRAFADDMWKEADDALREAIVRQWQDNRAATGGHEWDPPEWAEIDEDGIKLPPFKWDEDRRAQLRAELDAYYAQLYGLNRKQLRYILDPHGLSKRELEDILDPWEDPTCSGPHLLPAEPALDFPSETFRVLKEKEEKQFGDYRTRRLVLEAWHRLHAEGVMPEAYDQRMEGLDRGT